MRKEVVVILVALSTRTILLLTSIHRHNGEYVVVLFSVRFVRLFSHEPDQRHTEHNISEICM